MKILSRILTLALLLAVALLPAACRAEEGAPEEAAAVSWRGYEIEAAWVTTDRKTIGLNDLPEDALPVLVRLIPREGVLQLGDIQDNRGDFFLVDADGAEWQAERFIYHKSEMNPETGWPSIALEQENVDILFYLTGKDEAALAGAQLKLAGADPGALALDGVTRDKPE